MGYLLIQFFFLLLMTVLFKKNFIDFLWLSLVASLLYLIINYVLPLPEGFNNDQYVYLELANDVNSYNIKTFYHKLFKPYFFLEGKIVIEYVQYFLGLSNFYLIFLLFNRGLNHFKMLFFLVLCSGYSLHVFTFLREPFLFLLITFFVYFLFKNKVLLSLIFIALIGLARVDALLYILPFWIIKLSMRYRFKHIYKIILFTYLTVYWFSFYGPLSVYTEPYIRQFTLLSGLESNISLIQNILNLITPSLSLPKILFQIQLIGILYFIFKLKNNTHFYNTSIYILLFTLLILLSISNNYGFLLRITSGMALMFFLIETNLNNLNKKTNET